MDPNTGRPNEIGDVLPRLHNGHWYRWTDSKNRIYANLRLTEKTHHVDGHLIDNTYTLPTESELNTKLAELQAAWDSRNAEYKKNRRKEYPPVVDQLDKIYHSGIDAWKADIKAIKDKCPKS